jgi:hypothetical protein
LQLYICTTKEKNMSICILFILANGFGYVTPACYDGYELVTPHRVAFVQHLPSEYDLYESPEYYVNYYWTAREEYCGKYNGGSQQWVPGHYSNGSYIPGYWTGGSNSWGQGWGQGWNFWTPNAKYRELCRNPNYLSTVHYYNIPYRVRYNVRNRLRTYRRHHHHSYKKHPRYKKYKKYGKYKYHYKKHDGVNKKHHYKKRDGVNKKHHYKKRNGNKAKYKKRQSRSSNNSDGSAYKKRQNRSRSAKYRSGGVTKRHQKSARRSPNYQRSSKSKRSRSRRSSRRK